MRDRYMQGLADGEAWRELTTLRGKFDYFVAGTHSE
jgi:hypothetical protein